MARPVAQPGRSMRVRALAILCCLLRVGSAAPLGPVGSWLGEQGGGAQGRPPWDGGGREEEVAAAALRVGVRARTYTGDPRRAAGPLAASSAGEGGVPRCRFNQRVGRGGRRHGWSAQPGVPAPAPVSFAVPFFSASRRTAGAGILPLFSPSPVLTPGVRLAPRRWRGCLVVFFRSKPCFSEI